MMPSGSALSSQHLFRRLIPSVTAITLCYFATGGNLLQTLLLALPLGIVFAVAGYVGGLLAFCGSLAGVTGVYALMNLILEQAPIPPALTYVGVSLASLAIAVSWQRSTAHSVFTKSLETIPLMLAPLLVALISGFVVFRWTRFTDLEFFNSLAGSEDNAAWISGARTFVSGEMTTDYLAHPTALSPVTGTMLGFVSDLYWITQTAAPEHVRALRALQTAYAFICTLLAMSAAMWALVSGIRVRASIWLSYVASVTIAIAALGSSIFLFVGVGHFSFINGVLFAFVVAVGFDVTLLKTSLTWRTEGVLLLVVSGFAGAWWGVTPLAASLIVILATTPSLRSRWHGLTRLQRTQYLVVWLLSLSTLVWTWDISTGRSIQVGPLGSTGTVPIVETTWLPIILVVVALLVARTTDQLGEWRQRVFHLLLAVYVALIWLLSEYNFGEPRYAAFKILLLLSLLTMIGLGVVLVERVPQLGQQTALVGLVLVLLWSSVVHESHNGIRGINRNSSPESVQATILRTLNENPNASVVCLHQQPELWVAAYSCSRFSAAFSPGRSPALNEWVGALLNHDMDPNGVELSREEHVGSRVLSRFRQELVGRDVVVILIGGDSAQGVVKDLGPGFWWVEELNWEEIQTVFL